MYWLIHQLPPKPLYLRAKIRRRLAQVGALAVKNSVYVLPERPSCLEDFQWIAQDAIAGGGEACVAVGTFVSGLDDAVLRDRFVADVTARYAPVAAALDRLLADLRKAPDRPDAARRLLRLRRQAHQIAGTDYFGAPAGQEVEALMKAIDRVRTPDSRRPHRDPSPKDLVGRVWVTRADPHVDRLATAWLIRRFVDPAARFRFVDPARGIPAPGELSFDMTGADFTHEGDRCSFETMARRLGLADRALQAIGEIVHDIDLKDGKFGRPDAQGVQQLVQGLVESHADSAARVTAALPIFDALFVSFGGRLPAARSPRRDRRPSRRSRRSRR